MEFTQAPGPECGVTRKRRGCPESRAGRGGLREVLVRAGAGGGGECAASPRRADRGVYPRGPRFASPASRSGAQAAPRGESPWLIRAPRARPAPCMRWRSPARLSDPGAGEPRRGLYVDCETTGFSPEHDAVIELALLPFTYTLAGTVVEVLHDEAQAHRNDPGRPLSPHGRGNLRRGRSARRMAGSIPARAGEPPTAGPASPSTRVYPRTGGGTSTKQQTDNAQLLRNKCRVCVLTGS